jgi:hypothetical protein
LVRVLSGRQRFFEMGSDIDIHAGPYTRYRYVVLAVKGKEEDGVEEKEEIAWLWRRNKVGK